MFRIGVPDWASKDAYAPGPDGQAQSWIWRAQGDLWLKYFYESVVDGAQRELGRAEQQLDMMRKSSASIAGELGDLKRSGARYVIAADDNGRVAVRILRPDEGVAAGLGRLALEKLGAGDGRREALLDAALGQLSEFASRIERLGKQIAYRQYGAVLTLRKIAAGQPSGFGLPDGATPQMLAQVSRVLVAALERDLAALRALSVGAIGVSLATRAASFENPYSAANVAAALVAALDDARDADARRKGFVEYPPPPEVTQAALVEAGPIAERVGKSPGYAEWLSGSHAQRELGDFGSELAAAAKAFSAMSSMFLGSDPWAITERSGGALDFVAAARKLAEQSPAGSKVGALFARGVELTRARADGAFQLVASPVEADQLQRSLPSLAR